MALPVFERYRSTATITRPVTGASDSDLLLETAGDNHPTTLVLSSRSLARRSAVDDKKDVVWLARRTQDQSVWSVEPQTDTDSFPPFTNRDYLGVRAPSSSWIDQYGAAAHYAFYAHVLSNPRYISFSAYA